MGAAMSYKTRKLTRAELSIAFSEAWIAARRLRDEFTKKVKQGRKTVIVSRYPDLRANFRTQLKAILRTMRDAVRVWVGPVMSEADRAKSQITFEIMQIEAKDFLTNADRARLAELKSLPLAA